MTLIFSVKQSARFLAETMRVEGLENLLRGIGKVADHEQVKRLVKACQRFLFIKCRPDMVYVWIRENSHFILSQDLAGLI